MLPYTLLRMSSHDKFTFKFKSTYIWVRSGPTLGCGDEADLNFAPQLFNIKIQPLEKESASCYLDAAFSTIVLSK